MKSPWILYVDGVATTLPLLSGVVARRRLSPARRWIVGWSGVTIALNVVALALAMQGKNNHWLGYLLLPVAGALLLWGLSCWQRSALASLAMRLAIPLLLVTWAGLVLRFEDTRTFSLVAEPFAGLLIMAAAIYTLVSRGINERGRFGAQDWFWISAGLVLYAGLTVALPPASYWLLTRHPELVIRAYELKAAIETVALLLISRGMFCPTPARPSGGSSSREPSRSRSSSSDSSRPW